MGEPITAETKRVRRIQDKEAPRYDRQISFFERILFGDGREWVCSQATGDVLELAVGTARNLRFYPDDVRITGVELSPEMLAIARRRLEEVGLRPGGRFLLMEHVRSPSRPVRVVERLLDPLSVRFQGDHLVRDPVDYLASVGFEIQRVERSKWGIVERVAARKPGDGGPAAGPGGTR